MPAVPKKKHSRNRKGGRDAHAFLTRKMLTRCPECDRALPPHRACPECGFYKGRSVVGAAAKAKESAA